MTTITKTKTEQILSVMPILAWVALVACLIEAGTLLFQYANSYIHPEAASKMYRGLDLYKLRIFSFSYFTLFVFLKVAFAVVKGFVCWLVMRALSKFNMENPFTIEVAHSLEKISYFALGTWLIAMLSNACTAWLLRMTNEMYGDWISGEFLFPIGILFIVSQVFKRGVEIQSENDLTV